MEWSRADSEIRGGDVGLGKADPILRNRVDVRRGNVGQGVLAGGLTVTEVIGEEDDHVRLFGSGQPGDRTGEEDEKSVARAGARRRGAVKVHW